MSQDAGATDDSSTKATLTTRGGVRHFNIKRSAANLVEHRKCTSCWIGMHNVPVEMPVRNGRSCCGNRPVQYRGCNCRQDRRLWAALRPTESMNVCVVLRRPPPIGAKPIRHRHRLATSKQTAFPEFRTGIDIERTQIMVHCRGNKHETSCSNDRRAQIWRSSRNGQSALWLPPSVGGRNLAQ